MVEKRLEQLRKAGKTYRSLNKEYFAERNRAYNLRQKMAVHTLLGGICVECGFSDSRALQIDHVNGGGVREKKGRHGSVYYQDVLASIAKGEIKYQLLCANCNWIKRFNKNETSNKYL